MYTDYLFPPSALSVESASLYYLTLISLIPQIFCAALAEQVIDEVASLVEVIA